jgi:hypothetical protein
MVQRIAFRSGSWTPAPWQTPESPHLAGRHVRRFQPGLRREFAQRPRTGDTVYGFVAGLYPTDFPTLPDPEDEPADT